MFDQPLCVRFLNNNLLFDWSLCISSESSSEWECPKVVQIIKPVRSQLCFSIFDNPIPIPWPAQPKVWLLSVINVFKGMSWVFSVLYLSSSLLLIVCPADHQQEVPPHTSLVLLKGPSCSWEVFPCHCCLFFFKAPQDTVDCNRCCTYNNVFFASIELSLTVEKLFLPTTGTAGALFLSLS